MGPNSLQTWLGALSKVSGKGTMNFESTAFTVFTRLIHGEGPGLLVLWGGVPGEPKANKRYFLNTVGAFQKGAAPAKPFVSKWLWDLLAQLEPGHYQCVSVTDDYQHTQQSPLYQTPLAVAVPLAIAEAACRRGLVAGRNLVILCDNIEQFMEHQSAGHHRPENQQFLRQLAEYLDGQTLVTFLGASQRIWDAKTVLGHERALPLGWD